MSRARSPQSPIGIAKSYLSGWATLPAAVLILSACGGLNTSSAAIINYTGESLVAGDHVDITSPTTVSGLAGQIKLTGVTGGGLPSTILAWCVDINHFLQGSGTYVTAPQITGTQNLEMGGLMVLGNALLAGTATLPVGLHFADYSSASLKDISAAVQVAIWKVEYSPFVYNISATLSDSHFGELVDDLVTYSQTHGSSWLLLDRSGTNNQSLGTVPVPGPLAGAGLPGLALLGFGLLWWRRRTKESSVALAVA